MNGISWLAVGCLFGAISRLKVGNASRFSGRSPSVGRKFDRFGTAMHSKNAWKMHAILRNLVVDLVDLCWLPCHVHQLCFKRTVSPTVEVHVLIVCSWIKAPRSVSCLIGFFWVPQACLRFLFMCTLADKTLERNRYTSAQGLLGMNQEVMCDGLSIVLCHFYV